MCNQEGKDQKEKDIEESNLKWAKNYTSNNLNTN